MTETISETSVSSEEFVSWPESKEDSGVMAARTIRPEKTQEEHGDVMLRSHRCLEETAMQRGRTVPKMAAFAGGKRISAEEPQLPPPTTSRRSTAGSLERS